MTAQQLLYRIALIICPTTKDGQKFNDATAALTITGASNATPIVITTSTNHGLVTGNKVYIASVTGNTNANNTGANPNWTITKLTDTTFSLDNSSGNAVYVSGGSCTPALIGSVDGSNRTRQRLLDIYNQARMALFNAIDGSLSEDEKIASISGCVIKKEDFTFASGSASKPSGFVKTVLLTDVNGDMITVLPTSMIQQLKDVESATNRMVFDYGTTLATLTGSTNVPNASTYILWYIGIASHALSDILGGTTVEPFNEQFYPAIIELAQAINAEQGVASVNALAKKLIGA